MVRVQLDTGVALDADIVIPKANNDSATIDRKLAVCLHPWSWLGGQKEDPFVLFPSLGVYNYHMLTHLRVLHLLEEVLLQKNYHILRYNSRGVGASSGWPSLTGYKEVEDLKALVKWALSEISDVKSLVIIVSLLVSTHE
jgi:uncharacterized protein